MRKHKRTQVCCSCILLNSWCGYVQKLSIQMKNHNRKQSFWGFFHISRCSNLPVCHLTTWEKNKLPTCTAGLQDVSVKDLRKIIFWHLYSFTKKHQHMLQRIQMTVSKMKVHRHTDRPAVTQVYTLISGKCLRPIKVESRGNKDQ